MVGPDAHARPVLAGRGNRLPKTPCPRCGANVGPMRLQVENLRHVGWEPYRVVTYVNWCGHAQEVIPVPRADGLVAFVPVLGGGDGTTGKLRGP
jgi:hypothetical protein